ncbi:MAG: RDD family protein [Chloroflexota bacterium]
MITENSNPFGYLNEQYTIETPENVTFQYDVAGIGSRFIGALLDMVILSLALMLLNVVAFLLLALLQPQLFDPIELLQSSAEEMWGVGIVVALAALFNFILFWGYFILFELIWNGQTPGKRLAGTRVIRMDGNPIGLLENIIRNLVRIIDFMPSGYGLGLVVMFCNPHARRLGDYAAGTLVIREKGDQSFDDFLKGPSNELPAIIDSTTGLSAAMSAPPAAVDPLRERFATIQQLSASDFELISDTLHRHQSNPVASGLLGRLAKAMANKLDMEPPDTIAPSTTVQFLKDVAEAYRRYHR